MFYACSAPGSLGKGSKREKFLSHISGGVDVLSKLNFSSFLVNLSPHDKSIFDEYNFVFTFLTKQIRYTYEF